MVKEGFAPEVLVELSRKPTRISCLMSSKTCLLLRIVIM